MDWTLSTQSIWILWFISLFGKVQIVKGPPVHTWCGLILRFVIAYSRTEACPLSKTIPGRVLWFSSMCALDHCRVTVKWSGSSLILALWQRPVSLHHTNKTYLENLISSCHNQSSRSCWGEAVYSVHHSWVYSGIIASFDFKSIQFLHDAVLAWFNLSTFIL